MSKAAAGFSRRGVVRAMKNGLVRHVLREHIAELVGKLLMIALVRRQGFADRPQMGRADVHVALIPARRPLSAARALREGQRQAQECGP